MTTQTPATMPSDGTKTPSGATKRAGATTDRSPKMNNPQLRANHRDPKYIDKRPLYTKLMEQAGRDYTAAIAQAEDVFFAGPDTQERRDRFTAAMETALVRMNEEEAAIELQYGAPVSVPVMEMEYA